MIGADLITGGGGGACWSGALFIPVALFSRSVPELSIYRLIFNLTETFIGWLVWSMRWSLTR